MESVIALARVLMRQARNNYAFPTERYQSVYLQSVLRQFDLEQHGDDILVCGVTRSLEKLTEEFNGHFLVKKSKKHIHFLLKKAEIVSVKHQHQNEIHVLKRRISVDNFGWHVELDQRYVNSLLDAMAMNHCKSMATPGSKGTREQSKCGRFD